MSQVVEHSEENRGAFSSRKVFILAAILMPRRARISPAAVGTMPRGRR